MHNDYVAMGVYATLQPLAGTTTAIIIRPDSAAASSTNPQFGFDAAINQFSYINASVGELHTTDFDWPLASDITITAP